MILLNYIYFICLFKECYFFSLQFELLFFILSPYHIPTTDFQENVFNIYNNSFSFHDYQSYEYNFYTCKKLSSFKTLLERIKSICIL